MERWLVGKILSRSQRAITQGPGKSTSHLTTDLNMLFIKIKAVINSVIIAVSNDHRDLVAYHSCSACHWYTTQPLTFAQDDTTEESSKSVMERYLNLRRLLNHLIGTKRWKQEYIHQSSLRYKWHKNAPPIQVGGFRR